MKHATLRTRVALAARRGRPLTPTSLNYSTWAGPGEERNYRFVWFRTRGCQFDLQGECTMCDYGVSSRTSPREIVEALGEALLSVTTVPRILLVSPSGSMFDDTEVPPDARGEIFRLVSRLRSRIVICESRPEFISADRMRAFRDGVRPGIAALEIGLESADPLVLRACLNKSSTPDAFRQAAAVAHREGVRVYANVLLGAPFLSASEAIRDAERTIRWALENGADRCVLFPVHVKPWTVISWLHELGLYQPASLWSLVEVLRRVGPTLSRRTNISWHRPQFSEAQLAEGKTSTHVPTTCEACRGSVLALLDRYRRQRSVDVLEALAMLDCSCKIRWREDVASEPADPLSERVSRGWRRLEAELLSPREIPVAVA